MAEPWTADPITVTVPESAWPSHRLGDSRVVAEALQQIGMLRVTQRDLPAARAYLDESLARLRLLGDQRGVAITLMNLGMAAVQEAEHATGLSRFRESLGLLRELNDRWLISNALVGVAVVAMAQGQPARALRLASAAAGIAEAIRTPLLPLTDDLAHHVATSARAVLGTAHTTGWAQEQTMSLEEALDDALATGVPSV